MIIALKILPYLVVQVVIMSTSTMIQELMKVGEALGYQGVELRDFVREQQKKGKNGRESEKERKRKGNIIDNNSRMKKTRTERWN